MRVLAEPTERFTLHVWVRVKPKAKAQPYVIEKFSRRSEALRLFNRAKLQIKGLGYVFESAWIRHPNDTVETIS